MWIRKQTTDCPIFNKLFKGHMWQCSCCAIKSWPRREIRKLLTTPSISLPKKATLSTKCQGSNVSKSRQKIVPSSLWKIPGSLSHTSLQEKFGQTCLRCERNEKTGWDIWAQLVIAMTSITKDTTTSLSSPKWDTMAVSWIWNNPFYHGHNKYCCKVSWKGLLSGIQWSFYNYRYYSVSLQTQLENIQSSSRMSCLHCLANGVS